MEQIDQDAVRAELEHIISSKHFSDSEQLSNFLTYVVSKTLDGQESDIKAYSIAVDALGRSEDFDPQDSAIVRVAARRLRQALSLYYAEHNDTNGGVKIELEPGSYVPTFAAITNAPSSQNEQNERGDISPPHKEPQIDTQSAAIQSPPNLSVIPGLSSPLSKQQTWAAWVIGLTLLAIGVWAVWELQSPGISLPKTETDTIVKPINAEITPLDRDVRPKIAALIIAPDDTYPDWVHIDETADSISNAISRFDDYQFLGTISGKSLPAENKSSPDYTLLATVHSLGENIRVFGKLTRESDGTVIWSAQQLVSRPDELMHRNIPQMVGMAFSPVGSPYGIIFSDLHKLGDNRPELKCYGLAYEYFVRKSDETYNAARNCSQTHVNNGSRLPSLHALLTFLLLEEIREGRQTSSDTPLVAAQNAARKAVELGPQSARAHQALFGVRKVQGNLKEAAFYGQQAIKLNPYDTDILGDYAAWQISIGNIKEGKKLLDQVKTQLNSPPAWFEVYQFLAAELDDDQTETTQELTQLMDPSRSPMTAFCVVIGAHAQKDLARLNSALNILKKSSPEMVENPQDNFQKRGFSSEVAGMLAEKFKSAEKFVQDNQQN